MNDDYTRLLKAIAKTEDAKTAEEAIQKLIKHLKSSGRLKLLPQIARELEKIVAARAKLAPKVEVASEKEFKASLQAAAKMGIVAKGATVNPALIRGWRGSGNGQLVDHSAKSALVHIYRNSIR